MADKNNSSTTSTSTNDAAAAAAAGGVTKSKSGRLIYNPHSAEDTNQFMVEAKKKGDKHACFMLADLMRVRGAPPEEMVKCFEGETDQGANTLNHLFVLRLEQSRWSEAAKVAAVLQHKASTLSSDDSYIADQVNDFVELLESRAKQGGTQSPPSPPEKTSTPTQKN